MFKLHVVQAQFGDSLILEFGTAKKPRYVLIDGGPPGNYAADLEPALNEIVGRNGTLDLVLLSHIDNDHIIGVLDLFSGIEEDDVSHRKRRVQVAGLWHNSFERTIDHAGEITQRMQTLVMMAGAANLAMPLAMDAFYGVREGNRLRLMTQKLKIPVNKDFKNGPIMVEAAKQVIKLGPLELRIAGPNKANLKALHDEWLEWLDKVEEKISSDPAAAAAMADRSIPNLSSIVVLAKCNGRTLLLTGDARGDHILNGLKAAGLAKGRKIHVDVLKVQHHGSDRNASRGFFDAVTANTYVISANGKYGNPDLETLTWIVESARDQQRHIQLILTNQTDSATELQKRFKPSAFNYKVTILDSGRHSLEVALSS
jgi:beta-lactamase superfamily II metal-dependent hydrolase